MPHRADDVNVFQRVSDTDTGARILLGRLSPLAAVLVHPGELARAGSQNEIAVSEAGGQVRVAAVVLQPVPADIASARIVEKKLLIKWGFLAMNSNVLSVEPS